MGLVKALSRSDAIRRPLCWLGAQYIRFVHATCRWQVVGAEIPAAFWDRGGPFILAFWHGRILMMPYCWRRDRTIRMLISTHPDGQIIARTVRHFGIDTVAGSSSKGGGAALRTMVRTLRAGECVGITPDGPRGPYMRASEGVAQVARLAGTPVIPCSFGVSRRLLLTSWDRFVLALPFGRGVFVWGEPILVATDASAAEVEQARRAIENSLNDITARADALVGQAAPQPAEAAA